MTPRLRPTSPTSPRWFARCAAFLLPRVPLLALALAVIALAGLVLALLVPALPLEVHP